MHLLTDKILRIPLFRTKMTAKILPLPIPVPTVYVLWSGLRVPAGYFVRCGRRVRHSGTLTGGARHRALLGWGLLVSGVLCIRVSWESWAYTVRIL